MPLAGSVFPTHLSRPALHLPLPASTTFPHSETWTVWHFPDIAFAVCWCAKYVQMYHLNPKWSAHCSLLQLSVLRICMSIMWRLRRWPDMLASTWRPLLLLRRCYFYMEFAFNNNQYWSQKWERGMVSIWFAISLFLLDMQKKNRPDPKFLDDVLLQLCITRETKQKPPPIPAAHKACVAVRERTATSLSSAALSLSFLFSFLLSIGKFQAT